MARIFLLLSVPGCLIAALAIVRAEPIEISPQTGILLLRTGSVLEGEITRVGQEYYVTLPNGEIRVPAGDVDLHCRSLDEAYQQKLAALRTGHVSEHIELAEWCLRNKLLEFAAIELMSARRADPLHPKLDLIERRLKLAAEPAQPATAKQKTAANVAQAGSHSGPTSTLADAAEELVKQLPPGGLEFFSGTIQPLLINSCASAACHGSTSDNLLRLERIPAGRPASHKITQRNLAAVMPLIDRENPAASPLLTMPLAAHGTAAEAVLTRADLVKYRQLVEWVHLVAMPREQASPASVGLPAAPLLQQLAPPRSRSANRAAERLSAAQSAAHNAAQAKPPAERTADKESEKPRVKFGAPLPAGPSADPFDPDLFNREFSK